MRREVAVAAIRDVVRSGDWSEAVERYVDGRHGDLCFAAQIEAKRGAAKQIIEHVCELAGEETTHQEIADELGLHRESVSRVVGRLCAAGLLEREGRSYRVNEAISLIEGG